MLSVKNKSNEGDVFLIPSLFVCLPSQGIPKKNISILIPSYIFLRYERIYDNLSLSINDQEKRCDHINSYLHFDGSQSLPSSLLTSFGPERVGVRRRRGGGGVAYKEIDLPNVRLTFDKFTKGKTHHWQRKRCGHPTVWKLEDFFQFCQIPSHLGESTDLQTLFVIDFTPSPAHVQSKMKKYKVMNFYPILDFSEGVLQIGSRWTPLFSNSVWTKR